MAMRASGGGGDDLNSEINVTPLVDVMLVLLIIFMVAAPMMNTGVDVEVPQVNAQKIEDPAGKLILSISPQGKLRLGSGTTATDIKWAELRTKLETNEKLRTDGVLWVEADKNLPYSVVVTAMAIAKDTKVVNKVQLLTDPSAKLDVSSLDNGLPAAPPPK
jgi:biopolymer transport protein TolR